MPASLDAVSEDDRKGTLALGGRLFMQNAGDVLARQLEIQDLVGEPFGLAAENCVPDSGDIGVPLDEDSVFGKPLEAGSQGNDAAAGERLDKDTSGVWFVREPRADVGNEPSLAAGIAEGGALGYRSDIDWLGHFNVFRRAVGDCRVVEFGRLGLRI